MGLEQSSNAPASLVRRLGRWARRDRVAVPAAAALASEG